jgi:hypothetical protein
MTEIPGAEMLIAISISIISILVSIFLIRMVANFLVIIAFIGAVVVPIGWYIIQLENGANISIIHLYVAAFVFAFLITLMTVPLWPIASIMQWTGKRERQRLDDIERQTHKKGQKKDPSLDIPDNRAD